MPKVMECVVVVKPCHTNVGLDPLSLLESRKVRGSLDDQFPNVGIFRTKVALDYLEYISLFLDTAKCPKDYTITKKHLVVCGAYY